MRQNYLILFVALCLGATATAQSSATVDCGGSVQISATPATGYHFVQWNDGNQENPRNFSPTADVTFTAQFAINQYTIVFKNDDGTVLQTETLNHGETVSYKQTTPTKTATVQYTYTFAGWSPTINSTATADATYTAFFDQTVNQYTITFVNHDGTVLQASAWEYGTTPVYSGTTPTKPADAANTYTFTGWDETISPVTGDKTYTAQFSNATNTYVITVNGTNGTTTGGGTFQYGSSQTITATADECYIFEKWSDGDTNATRTITVSGNTTYTAIFKKVQYTVTVNADDASHGTVSVTVNP